MKPPLALLLFAPLALAAVAALLLALGARRRFATGRAARLLRIGGLGARLSTSRLGAALRRGLAPAAHRARIDEQRRRDEAELVARTMGSMKGAFMKLGQILSFITDDLPPEYRAALAQLQAQAPPMDFALLRDVAEHDLGAPLERAFARFDAAPLAAASIGQVHRAQLPSGEEVVVKIQYPGVADAIRADLDNASVLYQMAAMMYPALDPKPVVSELRDRISEELDYGREAESQRRFARIYDLHPFIRVPRVVDSHSAGRVLTSEWVAGRRFADVLAEGPEARSRWGEILYRFVFGSIVRHSAFNGDPHPGNYLFDEQGRMVFLDYGCVKYFPDQMRRDWQALVLSHMTGDRAQFRERAVGLGFLGADSPVDTALLYDYFAYFYDPILEDRDYRFTRDYTRQSLKLVFAPDGRFAGIEKRLNMPRDFVFVNRIQWGVYSILGELEAEANWHRIERELLLDEPPSTELGRLDAAYRAGELATL
jgi:predicted unusual protein kinase regulating ubiquinone biosynthesis (AarF/ABC1/UbiB family)